MSNNRMDMTNNDIFKLGMAAGRAAGRQQLVDHIQHQFKIGKPVEINGELYWLKGAKQNLQDIMDDIESAWNDEYRVKKFIVPIKKSDPDEGEIIIKMIIQTETAERARIIAIANFQRNDWIVDTDYENYKQFKG